MNSSQTTTQPAGHVANSDEKRSQKTMQNFKRLLRDLIHLFRKAAQTETVYLYWVNNARRQFVLETKSTALSNAVFPDRVNFEDHFLDDLKNLDEPATLTLGEDIKPDALTHYTGDPPVDYITILPFIRNEETVAVTVVESSQSPETTEQKAAFQTFNRALENTVNTFLEMNDLYENQETWNIYEKELRFLQNSGHYAGLLKTMVNTMQQWLNDGSISLIGKGMGSWTNILNSEQSTPPLTIGLQADKDSITGHVINDGDTEFAVHFNQNPKRLSERENRTEGATLAIPLTIQDQIMGVVLVYDNNPLLFKESVKHKFINTVRLTSLNIANRLRDKPDSIFTHPSGAIIPDMWERMIDCELRRLQAGSPPYHTWVSSVNLTDLSEIRTQLRLQDLDLMKKDLVHVLNPGQVDVSGFIGFYSDYTFIGVIQSRDPDAQNYWAQKITNTFEGPFQLTNGKQISTGLEINSLKLNEQYGNSYEVMTQLKK